MGKPATSDSTSVPIFSLGLSKSQTVSKYCFELLKWENETRLPGDLQGLNGVGGMHVKIPNTGAGAEQVLHKC